LQRRRDKGRYWKSLEKKESSGSYPENRREMEGEEMIRKIVHIGLAVKKMEEAEKFFTEVLSLGISGREMVGDIKITIIPVGDTAVELLQSTTPGGSISKFIEERGEGIHHIAYRADDIEKALEDLKAKGISLIDEQPRKGIHNSRIAFPNPQNSYGAWVELVEQEKK
jgi:methylmalonyl-CoA/ethylmalonyl-CoA epimerase